MASSSISTSLSPSSNSNIKYDVFINHRGPDVKKTLASHLYHILHSHGFRTFLDKQEMQAGQNSTCQIEGAITTASVHIAIFSRGYAESQWCLNELWLMLKSKGTVIPVFFHVKPSDLRIRNSGTDGVYAEALRIHANEGRYNPQTIENWITALWEVSSLSGFELETFNGDEGELVDRVVQRVKQTVKKPQLYVAKHPIGLGKKLQDFEETVLQQQQHSGETKVVGIVGSGGVGKTTLATEFFNCNRSAYNQSCFLGDVRIENLHSLQNKLLRDMSTSWDLNILSVAEGISELSRRLLGFKALVILDDVDDAEKLKALFSPLKEALSSDSLILLTSRNRDVLSSNGVSSIYKLTGLDREDSQELFCLHAFHNPLPVIGFEEMVTKFLDACDGLPLSLEVLGEQLYQKDLKKWKAQSCKIISDIVLPADIESSLRISYDSLDKQEREIFLDIACFFIKENRDMAIRIWDASRWQGELNLENLECKSLVEIDSKNYIRMHNHLRDLGRNLVEKELPTYHRRLWRPTDNLFHNAFRQPILRGINMVEGISGQPSDKPVVLGNRIVDMSGFHLLKAQGDCLGSISNLLRESKLLWLRWDSYPSSSLLFWIPMENLTLKHLDLQQARIKELSFPQGICPNLEHLNISYCGGLVKVGALPTKLTSLQLQECSAVEKITGLPDLAKLRLLDISGCNEIKELPGLETLTSLEEFRAFECNNLKMGVRELAQEIIERNRSRL